MRSKQYVAALRPVDGRLMLSTLHATDAPSAAMRLVDMEVEPYLVAAALDCVLAQRLARKLCVSCCEMYNPSSDELLRNRVSPDVMAASDGMAFYRKKGCPRCSQTGYKGRIGIYQLLLMSEEVETLAVKRSTREEIETKAKEQGMRSLWDDGLAKVVSGVTALEELGRVLA